MHSNKSLTLNGKHYNYSKFYDIITEFELKASILKENQYSIKNKNKK